MLSETSLGSRQDIAAWMLHEVDHAGILYQREVVEYLERKYGGDVTYLNSKGKVAVAKPILEAFNTLSAADVVWVRAARYWRKRQAGDPPGRLRR